MRISILACLIILISGLSGCFYGPKPDEIVVFKSERELALVRDNEIYKTYDIALGQNPIGHKEQEGDSRTPEGRYYIEGRNPNSRFFLSLRISYPDEDDITFAEEVGLHPGSDIMIHGMRGDGTREDFLQKGDWTEGCIALTNDEMEELWHLIEDGTPITILP
jgi:murein L,D-transpeptidase YafK